MRRSRQERGFQALSILFGAVPFAFALVRAVRTGYDLRYLWVALGALLGATVVLAVGRAFNRRSSVTVALSAGSFVIATLLATGAALLLGTRLSPGVFVVGSGFGFCCAASCVLHALAHPQISD
jgi:hypothetical protein